MHTNITIVSNIIDPCVELVELLVLLLLLLVPLLDT